MSAAPALSSVFDAAHFDVMTGADRALQKEVVDLFRLQAANWRAHLSAGDDQGRETAHTVKGSARGIGLWRLAEVCDGAEHASADDAEAAFAAVHAHLDEALAALGAY